jgi:methylated-DNA-[protein]-cysteine S-methyltransferase
MRWTLVPSPVDELLIGADEHGLCVVGFHGGSRDLPAGGCVAAEDDPVLRAAAGELAAYFEGRLTEFTVPLSVRRGSEFERAVWAELARIPYGQTRTYGEIAAATGSSVDRPGEPGFGAARAVGVACNRNPLPIVVPCHRVVGAGRKLVGFGGGLDRKRFLLELEAKVDLVRALG